MPACPKCGSEKLIEGRIRNPGKGWGWDSVFRPKTIRWFCISLDGGVVVDNESFACLDCGLIWSSASPEELRSFVKKHCRGA